MAADALPDDASPTRLLALTAQIVSAHVRGNKVGAAELPRLIEAVGGTLGALGQDPVEEAPRRPEPAVPVRRSVFPDAIACLECRARFKMLKRHLATDHGMAPEEYRARWDLPRDYPLVAPDYAATRSDLAKQLGLGRKRAPQAEAPEEAPEEQEAAPGAEPELALVPDEGVAPAPKRRGRRKAGTPADA